jgi:tRNA(adenine34) deaminase
MVNSRVRRVIFGMPDPRSGACGGALDVTGFKGMLWNVEVKSGVLELECRDIIQRFFKKVRESKINS